ncbi:unnamed protein product, partial [Medioppia subpectinata]
MVKTYVKVSYIGFVLSVIGVGIGSTFVPQLKREKRDFTIKTSDKQYIESLPKDNYRKAIDAIAKSDKPFFGVQVSSSGQKYKRGKDQDDIAILCRQNGIGCS